MPTVSVIMGIYNCESTLSDAIDSIISQTFTDWELIMCDDGSTDNTYEIAKKYSVRYRNIKLIKNNKNSGLAYSLNQCLKHVNGKYVARMDADDFCLPERFEKQVKFLDGNLEYQVVGSSVQLFDGINDLNIRQLKEIPEKKDLIKGVPHAHPTIMMRKEVYDNLKGYNILKRTHRCEDLDLWFRFYAAGYKGYNFKEPLIKYREGINDYKRRTIKSALNIVHTNFVGYRLIKTYKYNYIFILKPILAACIPKRIMYLYHKKFFSQYQY